MWAIRLRAACDGADPRVFQDAGRTGFVGCGGVGLCRDGGVASAGAAHAGSGSLADLKGNKKKFFIGTVGTGAMFACRADLPDDLVYEIVKTVYSQEGVDYLGNVIAALKSMSPNLAVSYKPIPLHPGAERYFREIGLIKD